MRESTGTAPGSLSLPSGGGGIAPLGERFQPDLVRGTGSYAVPLNCPKGPNELQPSLALVYSTGSGNGRFGFGWRLNVMRIERRTDQGIPSYTDDDTFVIGDAEVLVHVGDNRYRPKTDNKFWLIERVGEAFRIRTGDGKTMLFGQTAASRESDGVRVFAWHLDEERDAAGNRILYSYRRDANRLYLKEVRYSIFCLRIIYEPRPDVLRNARCGFERLTALRAKSIELHCKRLTPTLMRTYVFTYKQAVNGASLLQRLTLSATAGGETASFPELTFDYSHLDFNAWKIHELQSWIAPPSIDDCSTQLVDLTADGLPDVLQCAGGRSLLWRNQGNGQFDGPIALDGIPSTVSLERNNVAFADLNGNGRVELFAVDQPLQLAFESTGKGDFRPDPIVFRDRPNLRLAGDDTRLMDMNGDGVTDLIRTASSYFLLYQHRTGQGWQEPQPVKRVPNLEQFPDISFGQRGVKLADMSGDGLQDFVSVKGGNVSYWPYLGNGSWGSRVEMQNPPQFPPGYRDDRVHVVDVDGDGCSDIVYFDYDRTLIWINQSGSGFAAPVEIPVTPIAAADRVRAIDLFGDGRPGFAWSAMATHEDSAGYRFLRFDKGRKPYLMTMINNGMGGRHEMEYATSTAMRLEDRARGHEWTGELPFPVQVLCTTRERDLISGNTTEIALHYHDGVYDGLEREFRGFTRVTVDLTGDESVPASRQEFEFFQGNPEEIDLVERERQRALSGAMLATRILERVGDQFQLRQESRQTWELRLEHSGARGRVYFPFLSRIETHEHSPGSSPQRIERVRLLDYDKHGNPSRRLRESFASGESPGKWIRSDERYTYTNNETAWLVKLPVRLELRDGCGLPYAIKLNYYDGPAFVGLGEGQADRGLPSRVQELKLLESRLPSDYVGGRNFARLGYELMGAGDTRGYYVTTYAVRRDGKGNIIEQKDSLGRSLLVMFDIDGVFPTKTTDARGKETIFTFNPRSGEPSHIILPDGQSVRYEYDPIGRLAATFETDDAGNEQLVKCWVVNLASIPASLTSIALRNGGRKREEFTPTTDFEALTGVSISRGYYDGFGKQILQVTTAPDRPGGVRCFAASKQVRMNPKSLVSVHFPPRFVPNLAYLPAPAPTPASVRQRYDVMGNIIEMDGPAPVHFRIVRNTFTIHHYEGAGAGMFGTAVPPGPPTRVEHFDARSRLIKIEEVKGDGMVITTSYDLSIDGRIEIIRDHMGQEMARYTLAGPSEPVRITHRDVGTRTYYRDAAGQMVERVEPDGAKLFYSYDALGRLTRIEHQATDMAKRQLMREIIYDHDPLQASAGRFLDGRIALVRESGNEIHYSYNRVGKTVREEITAGGITLVTSREYDLQGRMTAIIYPDGRRVNYKLDDGGIVKEIPGFVTQISYAADGTIEGYRLANGVEIAMPRDQVSRRLKEVTARKDTSTLRRLVYTYNTVGNITGLHDEMPGSIEHQTFTYDGLYRLSSFNVRANNTTGTILRTGVYGYDAAGNIIQFEETQPLTLGYTDAAHPGRVTAVTQGAQSRAISYNERGQIRAFDDLAGIEFDPLDRVSCITKTDDTQIRFSYDMQNRRILKEVTKGAVTTRVHYATGLYERFETHALRHIYLGILLVASEKDTLSAPDNTIPVYYLSDHHGTVLMATDAAGTVIHQQRYSPFGAILITSTALDRYLGRERDAETGLIHLGARYYAPAIGRFISPDWYVLENLHKTMRIPQGFNLYSYALNNPLIFRDPTGLWFGIDDLIIAVTGFVVGFVSGLIYGLVNGQGWNSFLTALETGLTTAGSSWLGWNAGSLVGLGPLGLVMSGMNGLISGIHGIYDWTSIEGWFAFLSDSTWGLIGTSLGNIVHVINLFGSTGYREDLSRRQNRHVYEGGFYLKEGFAFTQGNVISNAGQNGRGIRADFINEHEELHIWQNRFFGPLFQTTYIVWAVGGLLVGTAVWFFNTNEDFLSIINTAAYYDNPFEYWAYKNNDNWPPSGANKTIIWGREPKSLSFP